MELTDAGAVHSFGLQLAPSHDTYSYSRNLLVFEGLMAVIGKTVGPSAIAIIRLRLVPVSRRVDHLPHISDSKGTSDLINGLTCAARILDRAADLRYRQQD